MMSDDHGEGKAREPSESPASVTREAVIEAVSAVYDPEIPVNIYELGLIYKIDIDDGGNVAIDMTVTAPACPVADTLPVEVQEKVRALDGLCPGCSKAVDWRSGWQRYYPAPWWSPIYSAECFLTAWDASLFLWAVPSSSHSVFQHY